LFSDDTTGDPGVASLHRQVQQRANQEVAKRVLSGIEVATPEEATRLHMVAEVLGGGTRSLIRWWYEHPEIPKEALVETVMDVVWRGIGTSLGEVD